MTEAAQKFRGRVSDEELMRGVKLRLVNLEVGFTSP